MLPPFLGKVAIRRTRARQRPPCVALALVLALQEGGQVLWTLAGWGKNVRWTLSCAIVKLNFARGCPFTSLAAFFRWMSGGLHSQNTWGALINQGTHVPGASRTISRERQRDQRGRQPVNQHLESEPCLVSRNKAVDVRICQHSLDSFEQIPTSRFHAVPFRPSKTVIHRFASGRVPNDAIWMCALANSQ